MAEDVVGTESAQTDGGRTDDPKDLFQMLREGEIEEPTREVDKQLDEFEEGLKPKAETTAKEQPEEAKLDTTKAAAEAQGEKTFKFDGKEYTETQLRDQFADPETLMDLLTAREQYRNLNRKHAETVERFKTVESELDRIRQSGYVQQPQTQQPPSQDTAAEIKKVLQRDAQTWVERGLVDKETYDAIPDVIHLLAYQQRSFQNFRDQAQQLYENQLAPMVQTYSGQLAIGERNAIVSQLENTLDQVASLGGVYEALREPETRANFVSHLGRVNPEIGVLFSDEAVDFMASQFVGFQRDDILSVYAQAARLGQPAQAPSHDARYASGERPGSSGARPSQSNSDIKAVLFSRG